MQQLDTHTRARARALTQAAGGTDSFLPRGVAMEWRRAARRRFKLSPDARRSESELELARRRRRASVRVLASVTCTPVAYGAGRPSDRPTAAARDSVDETERGEAPAAVPWPSRRAA